jgi:putative ATP-dependent endonuclease of OLD family
VRFLEALEIPWVVVTDGDPDQAQTGEARAAALLERLDRKGEDPSEAGIFVGGTTLERDVYDVSAANRRLCLEAIRHEQIPAADVATIEADLKRDEPTMDSSDFLQTVAKAGKGRFAQRLAGSAEPLEPPPHFRSALDRITP